MLDAGWGLRILFGLIFKLFFIPEFHIIAITGGTNRASEESLWGLTQPQTAQRQRQLLLLKGMGTYGFLPEFMNECNTTYLRSSLDLIMFY